MVKYKEIERSEDSKVNGEEWKVNIPWQRIKGHLSGDCNRHDAKVKHSPLYIRQITTLFYMHLIIDFPLTNFLIHISK